MFILFLYLLHRNWCMFFFINVKHLRVYFLYEGCYENKFFVKLLLSLLFQVISAQQLPKPEWDKPSSIVDPQVWVEIHGVPIDNNKKKTHHIVNNGK